MTAIGAEPRAVRIDHLTVWVQDVRAFTFVFPDGFRAESWYVSPAVFEQHAASLGRAHSSRTDRGGYVVVWTSPGLRVEAGFREDEVLNFLQIYVCSNTERSRSPDSDLRLETPAGTTIGFPLSYDSLVQLFGEPKLVDRDFEFVRIYWPC